MTRAAAALAAVGAGIALAGCSSQIDGSEAARLIRTAVSAQVGSDVRSVRCPGKLEAKAGATFRCTVTGTDGTTGQALVTEKDDKGHVAVDAPFLHTHEVERLIAADIKRQDGRTVTLTCPEIVTVRRGARFDCRGRSDGRTARIAVTQQDARGHVRYRVRS